MLRDNQKISSYPLPAKGGTPPILRGERHADYYQRCMSVEYTKGDSVEFLAEVPNPSLPLR